MAIIDLRQVEDTFVLHFKGEKNSVNAYTFASVLVALADAAKSANQQINPGYEIELVVEALSTGSVKATVRSFYKSLGNLFSTQAVNTIILNLIASYIYAHSLAPDTKINITVDNNEVIVQQGDTKVIVDRRVYEAQKSLESSSRFKAKIGEAFYALDSDPEITAFSIDKSVQDELLPLTKQDIHNYAALMEIPTEPEEVVEEVADLEIVRAILEKSRRLWEFSWRGFRISAPILDESFYDSFISHNITIAPGDRLQARIRIYQSRDTGTNVRINRRYEVIEVLKHQTAY